MFRIFYILKINGIMPFCNLFIGRPFYFSSEKYLCICSSAKLTQLKFWLYCGIAYRANGMLCFDMIHHSARTLLGDR